MGSHHPIRKTVSPEPVAIPDKLYFRIGDVARLCQVPAYVLRFWETEFPNLKPNKGGTGQRLYRRKDVEMALRIKSLLYDQGYTIPGARQIVKAEARPRETEPTGPADAQPAGSPTLAGDQRTVEAMGSAQAMGSAEAIRVALPAGGAVSNDDIGEAIRRNAHLRGLRDELCALLDQLGGPAAMPQVAPPVPAAVKPMRPRLMLEPKPAAKASPASPLRLQQGDLFSAEPPELAE
jgi:DNA-binding transcriptional MerR regulator